MKNRKKVKTKISAVKTEKILTHEQMTKIMLKNKNVRIELERLNREEFAILDEILAARKKTCLLKTEI